MDEAPTPNTTSRLGLDPFSVSTISILACGAISVWGLVSPDSLSASAQAFTGYGLRSFDWFFLGSCTLFLLIVGGLALSRAGDLKLGKDDDEPEFSTVSWLAMLFAGGMGAGLVFWGAAEPVTHFMTPPPGGGPETYGRARWAMVITNLHWGLHAWGIYALGALVLAYFGFRRDLPLLASTPFRATLPARWGHGLGRVADVIAVLAVVFGVTGSLGMGVMQITTGLHSVFGTPAGSTTVSVAVLVVLTISYMLSAGTSLDKGIQILSNVNMGAAVLLMLFVLFAGPTQFLLSTFVTSIGDYFANLVELSTRLFHFSDEGAGWLRGWTLTYLIWWIAWAPFVGIFVARISRGRTIREFVIGVVFMPTMFSLLWFGVFGGTGLHVELFAGGGYGSLVLEDVSQSLFSLFDYFPLTTPLKLLALFLVFTFLVTSADSSAFVLGMMTSEGSLDPPTRRKLTWGVIIGFLTTSTLLSGGGVHVMRAIAIVGAIPFVLIMVGHVLCLFFSLAREPAMARSLSIEEASAFVASEIGQLTASQMGELTASQLGRVESQLGPVEPRQPEAPPDDRGPDDDAGGAA